MHVYVHAAQQALHVHLHLDLSISFNWNRMYTNRVRLLHCEYSGKIFIIARNAPLNSPPIKSYKCNFCYPMSPFITGLVPYDHPVNSIPGPINYGLLLTDFLLLFSLNPPKGANPTLLTQTLTPTLCPMTALSRPTSGTTRVLLGERCWQMKFTACACTVYQ